MSITYSESVSVALGIQHAIRIRHIIPSSVACPHCFLNGTVFKRKVVEY